MFRAGLYWRKELTGETCSAEMQSIAMMFVTNTWIFRYTAHVHILLLGPSEDWCDPVWTSIYFSSWVWNISKFTLASVVSFPLGTYISPSLSVSGFVWFFLYASNKLARRAKCILTPMLGSQFNLLFGSHLEIWAWGRKQWHRLHIMPRKVSPCSKSSHPADDPASRSMKKKKIAKFLPLNHNAFLPLTDSST